MKNIILAENIFFSYGSIKIFDNVTISFDKGELSLFCAPNGAGKTTFFNILNGKLRNYQGNISILDKNIKKFSKREIAQILTTIEQKININIPITSFEAIVAGRYPYTPFFSSYSEEDEKAVLGAAKMFNITHLLDKDINTLSGGEQKKIMLASAFVQNVDIILYDEPFAFLDPWASSSLIDLIRELKNRGKTQLVISHNTYLLNGLADSIISCKNGKLKKTSLLSDNATEILSESYKINYINLESKEGKRYIFADI